MGVHPTATSLWQSWTERQAEKVDDTLHELPQTVGLEGPFIYWRSGSTEVQQGFLGLSGCYLLFGSKWNVFEDFLDVSHLSVNCMGTMLSLSGGQDTVLRLFLGTDQELSAWSERLAAASYVRVSEAFRAQLRARQAKQTRATRRRALAALVGRATERLCGGGSPMGVQAKQGLKRSSSMRLEGAETALLGRFYLKSTWTEARGLIYIHGDALLLQSSEGPHTYRAVALTGATATAAGFMVSVRAATGLALLRLWLESHEEAEQLAEQIGAAGRASEALVQRKALPTTSTWRRQLGRVAESLCNATMQLPLKVRRSVPKCGCWERKLKVRTEPEASFLLDGRCSILRANQKEVVSCHCVLRGDALWFGPKAGALDQVMSVVNASAKATKDMVMITARTGDVHRLWPDDVTTARKWCEAIQAAGQISKDLGKWDAMKRSAFFQDAARERVVQVQRSARFRAAGRCVARASGALAALVWSEKPSATRALMQWQEASRLPQEVTHNEAAYPSCKCSSFLRRAGHTAKGSERSLELRGDVIFVFNEGKMEPPVMLQGASVFVNRERYHVVSVWQQGVMQARIFLETEEEAERWGELLEGATGLLEAPEEVEELLEAPISRQTSRMKVAAPAKVDKEDHVSKKLSAARSRRFVESASENVQGA